MYIIFFRLAFLNCFFVYCSYVFLVFCSAFFSCVCFGIFLICSFFYYAFFSIFFICLFFSATFGYAFLCVAFGNAFFISIIIIITFWCRNIFGINNFYIACFSAACRYINTGWQRGLLLIIFLYLYRNNFDVL